MKRLVVGVLGAALLGLTPMALAAAPAQAGAATESRLKMAPQARKVYRYAKTIRIAGQIQARNGGGWGYVNASDDSVTLYRQMKGSTSWRRLDSVGGSSKGKFAFATPSRGNATYRVAYSGSSQLGGVPATSARKLVYGSRNPRGNGDKRSGRLYYEGNVDPGWGKRTVVIQKKACRRCSWRTYRSVRTGVKGGYSARIAAPSSGNWYFRSRVKGAKPRFVTGTGNTVRTFKRYGRTPAGQARIS